MPAVISFSFGLILYELAAGERAFVRPSNAEVLAAIIRDEAAPLPPSVLVPIRWWYSAASPKIQPSVTIPLEISTAS